MKRIPFLILLLLAARCMTSNAAPPTNASGTARSREFVRSLVKLVEAGGGALLRDEKDSGPIPTDVAAWMQQHYSDLLTSAATAFTKPLPWGVARSQGHTLYFYVLDLPADRRISFPRLHNSLRTIRLGGHVQPLGLKPNVASWDITLPKSASRMLVPVLKLDLDGSPRVAATRPPTVKPGASGTIILHARDAITHGGMLRFEPQPHKNTVGYWTQEDDWAEWLFQVPKATDYHVELRYGCGQGQGGSQIELRIGRQTIPFEVAATGGFQAWRNVQLGRIRLPASAALRLTIRTKRKAHNAVMDVRQVTLRVAD